MALIICLLSLAFLIFVAYRGFSVIIFAPVAALLAVFLTNPIDVLPAYSGLFQDKMVIFIKLYFPVFLLGALFGKVIEISGFARSIVASVIRVSGSKHAIPAIILVCCLLTYGGVSVFVVVFAVYPFAAEMFRQADIPKRLIPGTIAIGAFTVTMDALPGTPQIQNIIPTSFFKTNIYAAPTLGIIGAIFILTLSIAYMNWRVKQASINGEGYGTGHTNEPETPSDITNVHPLIAISPLVVVGLANLIFTRWIIKDIYGQTHSLLLTPDAKPIVQQTSSLVGIWSVEVALVLGILLVVAMSYRTMKSRFIESSKQAVSGALLASLNTASEFGFGSVIAMLPGFIVAKDALALIPNPLLNEAISVNILAGMTGSASGGMSIALAAMSDTFISAANAAHIPLEVLHRVASMASGGMDTLPHNGAIITLLAITGLTHRQSYGDIFVLTCTKTVAAFFIIGVYYVTGLV